VCVCGCANCRRVRFPDANLKRSVTPQDTSLHRHVLVRQSQDRVADGRSGRPGSSRPSRKRASTWEPGIIAPSGCEVRAPAACAGAAPVAGADSCDEARSETARPDPETRPMAGARCMSLAPTPRSPRCRTNARSAYKAAQPMSAASMSERVRPRMMRRLLARNHPRGFTRNPIAPARARTWQDRSPAVISWPGQRQPCTAAALRCARTDSCSSWEKFKLSRHRSRSRGPAQL